VCDLRCSTWTVSKSVCLFIRAFSIFFSPIRSNVTATARRASFTFTNDIEKNRYRSTDFGPKNNHCHHHRTSLVGTIRLPFVVFTGKLLFRSTCRACVGFSCLAVDDAAAAAAAAHANCISNEWPCTRIATAFCAMCWHHRPRTAYCNRSSVLSPEFNGDITFYGCPADRVYPSQGL
jgi:hypothetical protein